MTPELIAACSGAPLARATPFAEPLTAAMAEFGIDTPERQAAFLAQVGHETNGFLWLHELWGPTSAQTRYEFRVDLGNTQAGDGHRFLGRGLIQVTGRANYARIGQELGLDLITNPTLLEQPVPACRSAGVFWRDHNLNALADARDFETLTRRINGGENGLDDREKRWAGARAALGLA